jgi:ATP-dependent DNA helicase RecG
VQEIEARKSPAATLKLDTPVQYVKGIGPRRAAQLAEHGIRTVAELVEYAPFRYEDRTRFRPIRSVREGEWALVQGRIARVDGFQARSRRLSVVELVVRDPTGEAMVRFFNQPYLRSTYEAGMKLILYGQAKFERNGGSVVFLSPECEIADEEGAASVHSGRVVPIYRKLGEMRTRVLRQILHGVVTRLAAEGFDPVPLRVRRQLRLPPRTAALERLHFPVLRFSGDAERAREMQTLNEGLSPAHKRLIFEELFLFQAGIRLARAERDVLTKSRRLRLGDGVRRAIKQILPFHPTGAQKRVLKEIADDLASNRPMSRLLQGDVGSGKTIVAAQAAIIAVENGFQVAFMAPTEILAEQHYYNLRTVLRPIGYAVGLLKGSLRSREKREVAARIASGEVHIAVGTHALIQEGVEFRNLALVIIDEQQRFGVVQRDLLRSKGDRPDVLVMTATPIPRSLALTLYGDLDVSVIDEMPPGRKPIETVWLTEKKRSEADAAVRAAVERGEQVYVVYPLVEESESSDLRAATEMARHLQEKVFPGVEIGLLHGKMKGVEKERVMGAFASGQIRILVATTVIEVGVDVPNATLMVVEHAERFGLAQLHQLRGRVGRGAAQSRCILIADASQGAQAHRRMEVLCETNDGFRIAEVDLELRGPGEVIGTRQSGAPIFKFADLLRDRRALELARAEAIRFVAGLRDHPDEEARRIARIVRERRPSRLVG